MVPSSGRAHIGGITWYRRQAGLTPEASPVASDGGTRPDVGSVNSCSVGGGGDDLLHPLAS